MINDQLLSQIGLLFRSVAPPLIRVTDSPIAPGEEPHWAPGERLPATVLTNLPNGRFQVQVDNLTLEMNLPKNTQPGDQMELVYVGNSPRLTFTLAPSLPAPVPVSAPLPPQEQALPAELSETAHMLGQLSQQGPVVTRAAMAQAPVLQSPPVDGRQLATALQKTVNDSGLFYESHQAQWVRGERSLEMLMQEPQAQYGQVPMAPAPESPQQPGAALTQSSPIQPNQSQPNLAPAPLSLLADTPATPAGTLPASTQPLSVPALLAGMDPNISSLLQQQLQVLDSRMIQWSGQIWPGQQMDWEISGMPAGQTEDGQQWQTRLNLALPNLGAVSAWLLIGPQGLQVRLEADAAQTRQVLAASTSTLDTALQAAGLNLTQLTIGQNG